MKDMRNYYFNMNTKELCTLRSNKFLRCQKLRGRMMGYFDQQELRTLVQQIAWIDAVLESRKAQVLLFP